MPDPKRDYVFIDESGDPGKPSEQDSTNYYMVHALHLTDLSMRGMFEHLNRLRYFQGKNKEIKNIYNDPTIRKILIDIFNWADDEDDVFATSVYIDKDSYEGPYLHESSPRGCNPRYFRSFMIRRALERHFYTNEKRSSELEIVIDRFISSREREDDLISYLKENLNLPNILHVVQVDSRYSDPIQLVDVLGGLVQAKYIKGWDDLESNSLDFVELICLNEIPRGYPAVLGEQN